MFQLIKTFNEKDIHNENGETYTYTPFYATMVVNAATAV